MNALSDPEFLERTLRNVDRLPELRRAVSQYCKLKDIESQSSLDSKMHVIRELHLSNHIRQFADDGKEIKQLFVLNRKTAVPEGATIIYTEDLCDGDEVKKPAPVGKKPVEKNNLTPD